MGLVIDSGGHRMHYALSERCEEVAMFDLLAIIMTCTPPPPYSSHHLFSGTLEYCTVCSANSLVAGPGSGMV